MYLLNKYNIKYKKVYINNNNSFFNMFLLKILSF